MTPTGVDFVAAMSDVLSIPGAHYGADDCPHRCNPELWPHCEDCSGSVTAAARRLGLAWANDCLGSFAIAKLGYAAHGVIPYSVAIWKPGALLTQGINQGRGGIPGEDHGHIGMAVGDGIHTLEARGHFAGIGMFYASALHWDGCYFPPGVDMDAVGPSPTPNLPAYAPGTLEDDLMTTIALPASNATPAGQHGIARAVRGAFNFVLLEAGGRLEGDVLIAGSSPTDKRRHYWKPQPKDLFPGSTIFDVQDLRPIGVEAIEAIYARPDSTLDTFMVRIPTPAK